MANDDADKAAHFQRLLAAIHADDAENEERVVELNAPLRPRADNELPPNSSVQLRRLLATIDADDRCERGERIIEVQTPNGLETHYEKVDPTSPRGRRPLHFKLVETDVGVWTRQLIKPRTFIIRRRVKGHGL